MCFFISVAVPDESAHELITAIPDDLAVRESRNRSLKQAIPTGWRLFVLTQGMCSCGLFLEESKAERIDQARSRLRKKFEKQKWSKAKIERALESAVGSHKFDSMPVGFTYSVREFITGFVESHDEIRIIAHWYDGDVDSEPITLAGTSTVSASSFHDNQFEAKVDWIICVKPDQRS